MQIFAKTTGRAPAFVVCRTQGASLLGLAMVSVMLAGCASPGPPLPPTLNLPGVPAAKSLSAERAGSAVTVRWTTPERTTDKLLIKGKVEAELCRELIGASVGQRRNGSQNAIAAQGSAEAGPCSGVVAKASVQPGTAGEAVDVLPAELASGPSRLLAYRVQLKNAAGRTAGGSAEVFAAAGDAPLALMSFRAHAAKAGVVLEWTSQPGSSGDAVELERTEAGASGRTQPKPKDQLAALSAPKEPGEVRLRAGDNTGSDPGGVVDRSVQMGHAYSYAAWRVRTVEVGGQKLEVRSSVSSAMTVKVEDIFAPDAPAGLVAVPGFMGEGDAARPAIDLSWEPNDESRIAGYRVYRRDGDEWRLISGAQLLPVAAYRDADVIAGRRYAYRVTAVGVNGMESAPSNEAEETAATR